MAGGSVFLFYLFAACASVLFPSSRLGPGLFGLGQRMCCLQIECGSTTVV